jgi:hypothetical protein
MALDPHERLLEKVAFQKYCDYAGNWAARNIINKEQQIPSQLMLILPLQVLHFNWFRENFTG